MARYRKILALTKFKAFANDKIIVTPKLKFDLGGVENIVEKGENAGYQVTSIFSISHGRYRKISAMAKFKAFADDTIIVTPKLKFDLAIVDNIVEKGENASNKHSQTTKS